MTESISGIVCYLTATLPVIVIESTFRWLLPLLQYSATEDYINFQTLYSEKIMHWPPTNQWAAALQPYLGLV